MCHYKHPSKPISIMKCHEGFECCSYDGNLMKSFRTIGKSQHFFFVPTGFVIWIEMNLLYIIPDRFWYRDDKRRMSRCKNDSLTLVDLPETSFSFVFICFHLGTATNQTKTIQNQNLNFLKHPFVVLFPSGTMENNTKQTCWTQILPSRILSILQIWKHQLHLKHPFRRTGEKTEGSTREKATKSKKSVWKCMLIFLCGRMQRVMYFLRVFFFLCVFIWSLSYANRSKCKGIGAHVCAFVGVYCSGWSGVKHWKIDLLRLEHCFFWVAAICRCWKRRRCWAYGLVWE